MRYPPDHKERARARLIEASGRQFRQHGFGGIGVDGLAREAGVTSGAFYGHFKSKDDAFEAALKTGLDELEAAIRGLQDARGACWLEAFVDLYLEQKRTCELGASCALQSLTPEVQRSDEATKTVFEERFDRIVAAIAQGLEGRDRPGRARALLAVLTGAVTLARACRSPKTGEQIAKGAKRAAVMIASEG